MSNAVDVAGSATSRTLQLKRGEAAPASLAALHKVAKAFDAVFAQTMLGKLLEPAIGAGLGGSGPGASVVQGMIEQNLADAIGKAGGFGVGRLIERTLGPRIATQAAPGKRAAAGGVATAGDGGLKAEGGAK
jgi:Rod binding domain-containing protein